MKNEEEKTHCVLQGAPLDKTVPFICTSVSLMDFKKKKRTR